MKIKHEFTCNNIVTLDGVKRYVVYCLLDLSGNFLYVGSSVHVIKRLKNHFNNKNSNEVYRIEIKEVASYPEMLLLESYLILALQPKWNRVGTNEVNCQCVVPILNTTILDRGKDHQSVIVFTQMKEYTEKSAVQTKKIEEKESVVPVNDNYHQTSWQTHRKILQETLDNLKMPINLINSQKT